MYPFELFLYGALAAGGVGLAAAMLTLTSAVRDCSPATMPRHGLKEYQRDDRY